MYSHVKSRVSEPAMGLILAGILSGVSGLGYLVMAASRSAYGMMPSVFGDEAYMAGYRLGRMSALISSFLSLVLAPVIIYGASRMMKLISYKTAKAAAILALIPCSSCCFIVSIPVGIWALVVLSRPETRQAFDQPYQPPDGYGWNP
ncbi:MAG: hypothetical protein AB1631_27685 [Acidobacteriota bacterium]